ncbi:hypothetical protein MXD63_20790 [Frankia sp. Cpl3]|nr:hypothetical protein [Parafrankia colletiae]MCK9902504.1 hypothetical protein [Frankia sp. Cpl3]
MLFVVILLAGVLGGCGAEDSEDPVRASASTGTTRTSPAASAESEAARESRESRTSASPAGVSVPPTRSSLPLSPSALARSSSSRSPSPARSSATPPAGSAVLGTYDGISTITLTTYDFCGPGSARRRAASQTYQLSSQLVIGRRQTDGTSSEPSPFSFTLAAGNPGATGAVSLASARVAATSGSDLAGNPRSPRLLLTYWQLAWSDGNLTGRLVDDHRAEGAAYNLFNGEQPLIPCRANSGGSIPQVAPLSPGATLRGRLGDGGADLTLSASTYSGMYDLQLRFVS